MATFLVRDPRNTSKVAAFGVNFRQIAPKDGPEGEVVWVVEVSANVQGVVVSPSEYVYLTSLDNMDLEIKGAVERLAARINWEPLEPDTHAPFVEESLPTVSSGVSIHSRINVVITDLHPSVGIDPDSIKLTINGIDATSEIKLSGNPQRYVVDWVPTQILYLQV